MEKELTEDTTVRQEGIRVSKRQGLGRKIIPGSKNQDDKISHNYIRKAVMITTSQDNELKKISTLEDVSESSLIRRALNQYIQKYITTGQL